MRKTILLLTLLIYIPAILALPVCSDTNQQDISKIPCVGLTVVLNCSGNVTAINTNDTTQNYSFETFVFTDSIYNFTLNLTQGSYSLIDCENNTALWEVGLFEQGYGINMFGIIIPSAILSLMILFITGRTFRRFDERDEEDEEEARKNNNMESYAPRSRLMPGVLKFSKFKNNYSLY